MNWNKDNLQLQNSDLKGTLTLVSEGGRITPIPNGYAAHCQIDKSEMQYSCRVYLIGRNQLQPGESCTALLKFIFGSINQLGLNMSVNSELQLNEGGRNIGTLDDLTLCLP